MASTSPFRLSPLSFHSGSFARTSRQLQHRLIQRRCPPCSRPSPHPLQPIPKQSNVPRLSAVRYHSSATPSDSKPQTLEAARASAQEAYAPPQAGLLSYLPSFLVPYAELIRLDKPTGTYYLFLPCLFSTLLAAPLTNPIVTPLEICTTSALFFSGALVMRGAGCTVNDLWDRNLDPFVTRTRIRPIARGAISVRHAIPFLGLQLFAGLAILLQFPQPACFLYATPSLLLVGTYPLAKRVTNYPQFVLGLTFSWGAIMGFPALGVDLLSNLPALYGAGCLYASCVAWTVVYDMIYAYQDIRDDAKAGIKSIALAQEKNAKVFLGCVSAVQVALLGCAGVAVGAGPVFFLGSCGVAGATLGYMIWKVNLKDVRDCWAWFRKGAWFTGGAISLGLLGEYLKQYYDEKEMEGKASEFKHLQL